MSLKDELDVRVRKFRSENPAPSIEEIDAEAKACAEREWKKLRKKFYSVQKQDKGVRIYVGTYNVSKDEQYFAHKVGDWLNGYQARIFRRIRYYSQTMEWLRKMAEAEGIRVVERDPFGFDCKYPGEPWNTSWKYIFIYNPNIDSKT